MTQMALVIDLNVCVGCQACVTSCKEWNTSGESGSLADLESVRRRSVRHLLQSRAELRSRRAPERRHDPLPEVVPALRGPAVRAGVSDRRQLQAQGIRPRAGRFRQVHRLQLLLVGLPIGAREIDEARKEMTKCTLCVDRIHDEDLSERDRRPACVIACPTSARLFGDIHDRSRWCRRQSEERGGYQLMPEWNTKPANHDLPRITTSASGCGSDACSCKDKGVALEAPKSLDAQLEHGQLHLASMATRI